MVLISFSWWAAGGRVGRLRMWQKAQLPGPREVEWLRRRTVSLEFTLLSHSLHIHEPHSFQDELGP